MCSCERLFLRVLIAVTDGGTNAGTGYMSNRGRQNVASYLALDLGMDWRAGGDWFESCLVDYDVCSNWGASFSTVRRLLFFLRNHEVYSLLKRLDW